jgi:hypothetical protein
VIQREREKLDELCHYQEAKSLRSIDGVTQRGREKLDKLRN